MKIIRKIGYGLDYAERLSQVERYDDAINTLKNVIQIDPSSKIAYRKLGEAHKSLDNLPRQQSMKNYLRLIQEMLELL